MLCSRDQVVHNCGGRKVDRGDASAGTAGGIAANHVVPQRDGSSGPQHNTAAVAGRSVADDGVIQNPGAASGPDSDSAAVVTGEVVDDAIA
jgi:hypothetical protein